MLHRELVWQSSKQISAVVKSSSSDEGEAVVISKEVWNGYVCFWITAARCISVLLTLYSWFKILQLGFFMGSANMSPSGLFWYHCIDCQSNIVLFIYKSLHNLTPQYLSDLLQPYTQSRALRSADSGLLQVPRARLFLLLALSCGIVSQFISELPWCYLSLSISSP